MTTRIPGFGGLTTGACAIASEAAAAVSMERTAPLGDAERGLSQWTGGRTDGSFIRGGSGGARLGLFAVVGDGRCGRGAGEGVGQRAQMGLLELLRELPRHFGGGMAECAAIESAMVGESRGSRRAGGWRYFFSLSVFFFFWFPFSPGETGE